MKNIKLSRIAMRVANALDPAMSHDDLKNQRELEKKTKDVLKKSQDNLGKQMEDLVKKGVSGDDITKAIGETERTFKDLEKDAKKH